MYTCSHARETKGGFLCNRSTMNCNSTSPVLIQAVCRPADLRGQFCHCCWHADTDTISPSEISDVDTLALHHTFKKRSFEQVLSIYSDFDPITKRLFSLADPEGVRVWQLKDMDEHPNWCLDRTTLLGYACHPVLPFVFSGASMAIEDGVTISTLLSPEVRVGARPSKIVRGNSETTRFKS